MNQSMGDLDESPHGQSNSRRSSSRLGRPSPSAVRSQAADLALATWALLLLAATWQHAAINALVWMFESQGHLNLCSYFVLDDLRHSDLGHHFGSCVCNKQTLATMGTHFHILKHASAVPCY